MKTILTSAALSPTLWDEVCFATIHIANRVLNRREKEKTPLEQLTGIKPTVSHLRTLGFLTFVKKYSSERIDKLVNNAHRGILVGFDELSTKIYRVYIPELNKVIRSSAVKFDERVFPLLELRQDQQLQQMRETLLNSLYFSLTVNQRELIDEPKTYKQAINSAHAERWKQAMKEGIESMKTRAVYQLVPRPNGQKVLTSKWVFVVKRTKNGEIERFKARLVIRGFEQQYEIDYTQTFAPVATYASVRTLLAIAAQRDMFFAQMDVKTAFLHEEIDHVIYSKQPGG